MTAEVDQALSAAEKAILKKVEEESADLIAQKTVDWLVSGRMGRRRHSFGHAYLASRRLGGTACKCCSGVSRCAVPVRAECSWLRPSDTSGGSSGRRLALARWLTARDHPLSARVVVNRIWQHHFGVGIVATPDNFGLKGSPPSHPELLDWLAVDLIEHDWRLKRLHRLIMTSAVYRQSSGRFRAG